MRFAYTDAYSRLTFLVQQIFLFHKRILYCRYEDFGERRDKMLKILAF